MSVKFTEPDPSVPLMVGDPVHCYLKPDGIKDHPSILVTLENAEPGGEPPSSPLKSQVVAVNDDDPNLPHWKHDFTIPETPSGTKWFVAYHDVGNGWEYAHSRAVQVTDNPNPTM